MRNRFDYTNNNQAFIFPYVVFIATIVLIVVTSSISTYKNQVDMTVFFEQQLKTETLFQMGITQFKQESTNDIDNFLNHTGQLEYDYPYGSIIIRYSPNDSVSLKIYYSLHTDLGTKYGDTIIQY